MAGLLSGKFAFGTGKGTAHETNRRIGLARIHPFGRRGDMFGVALNYSEPSQANIDESVFESFYRLRLTQTSDRPRHRGLNSSHLCS